MINSIKDFIEPVNPVSFIDSEISNQVDLLFSNVFFFDASKSTDFSEKYDIAIIGVPEDRNSTNKGTEKAASYIRNELYKLYTPSKINIVDFGNIKKGKSVKDTYFALTDVVYELLKNELAVIILGGSKDLIYPICKAYEKGKKLFNLCVAEPKFNLKFEEDVFNENTYLSEILQKNKKIFNYVNLGYQTYYNSITDINFIHANYEALRLGLSRANLFHNEPFIRDADIFALDMASIKKSDAPGIKKTSIHGYYGEEMCQLAKYAGLSDHVSTFGIFNLNPDYDIDNQTAELSAQIIWHFIQAFYGRKNEFPEVDHKKFRKFIVNAEGIKEKIIFYKSNKTGRWWFEIPYKLKKKNKIKFIPCSFDDYIKATGNEIPERWWKFYQKLN